MEPRGSEPRSLVSTGRTARVQRLDDVRRAASTRWARRAKRQV